MGIHVLENQSLKVTVNTKALAIESIYDKAENVQRMWTYDKSIWPRRTNVCFPVCGLLNNDSYRYLDKIYHMGHHGIMRDREAKLIKEADSIIMEDKWDSETLESYPFKYDLMVTYSLLDTALKVTYKVTNLDIKPMFYSIGSHYTYRLFAEQSQSYIHFSKRQSLSFFDRSTASKSNQGLFNQDKFCLSELNSTSIIIDQEDLDTSFIGLGTEDEIITTVKPSGFRYLVIWAIGKGESPFVCIENWDGMVDIPNRDNDIETKLGIRRLESLESKQYVQIIDSYKLGDKNGK